MYLMTILLKAVFNDIGAASSFENIDHSDYSTADSLLERLLKKLLLPIVLHRADRPERRL